MVVGLPDIAKRGISSFLSRGSSSSKVCFWQRTNCSAAPLLDYFPSPEGNTGRKHRELPDFLPLFERINQMQMIIETDFTSGRHTLVFENRRIRLDKSESRQLDLWLERKIADNKD